MEPKDIKGGYDRLAQLMSACNSMAIFRRFATLYVENILYLQADLARLEAKLRKVQQMDRQSTDKSRWRRFVAWELILDSQNPGSAKDINEHNSEQLETILEIRARLKDYR